MITKSHLFLLLALVAVQPATAAAPVALVYSLAGEATLRVHAEERRPLRLFDRFAAGATVEVGSGSHLALAFANGRRYELGGRSRVTLGPADLASRNGPVRPLASFPPVPGLSPIAAADRPGERAGAVRIRGEEIAGLYPGHGAATLAGATVLRFEPIEGGARYRVEVQDRQGKLIFEAETTASAVTLPTGLLRPGTSYDWSVRTVERAGPVAQGKADFVTLSSRTAKAREALRNALMKEGDSTSLALLAEVDRSLGLLAESRDELRAGAYLQSP
ncbi:MAG: hypothetical protein JF614_29690 [Acidobacteria bacterium]|nr:hypothetical protein [Acidobacteriota bacterium]